MLGPVGDFLKLSLTHMDEGSATYELPVTPEILNRYGVVHGGAIATLADYCMGTAAHTVLSDGEKCLTLEMKVNYMTGTREGTITGRAEVIKRTRNFAFVECRMMQSSGKLAATASGSFAIRPSPETKPA